MKFPLPLAKNVLSPLGVIVAAFVEDSGIWKNSLYVNKISNTKQKVRRYHGNN